MTLILVYNADDGLFNAMADTLHKVLSPQTYACRLCAFTHGTFGMLRPWKVFLEALGLPLVFYHRREFAQVHPRADVALPAILVDRAGVLEVLVSAAEIDACRDLDSLIEKVRAALAAQAVS